MSQPLVPFSKLYARARAVLDPRAGSPHPP